MARASPTIAWVVDTGMAAQVAASMKNAPAASAHAIPASKMWLSASTTLGVKQCKSQRGDRSSGICCMKADMIGGVMQACCSERGPT